MTIEERVAAYNRMVNEAADLLGIDHPVLRPQLVPLDQVEGNDYNPNKVAPPEMKLLRLSIEKDGLTMPVVVSPKDGGGYVVVDGFHRTTTVKGAEKIRDSLCGYLPVTMLNKPLDDRITATVRHNMARGSHQVELSANLLTILTRHHWTNERIAKELGMDSDEVLRLKQIKGLAEAFKDKEFSMAWEPDIAQV